MSETLTELKKLQDTLAANQKATETELNKAKELGEEATTLHKAYVEKADEEFANTIGRIADLERKLTASEGYAAAMDSDSVDAVQLKNEQEAVRNYMCGHGTTYEKEDYKLALASAPDTAGGFLVPETVERGIIFPASDPVGMRQLVTAKTLEKGDKLRLNKMSRPIASWGKKAVAVEPHQYTVGKESIDLKFITSLYIADIDFLADTDQDVVGEISRLMAEEFSVLEDAAFVAGAHEDQPDGFVVNATIQASAVNSGLASALGNNTLATNGYDVLMDLATAPKAVYAANGVYAMNRFTATGVRKLKDLNGQFLWSAGTERGMAGSINGYNVKILEAMPSIAANTFPIAFGDFNSAYRIRDKVGGVSVQRLEETYATSGHVGILFRKRVLGGVANPEALSLIKIAV